MAPTISTLPLRERRFSVIRALAGLLARVSRGGGGGFERRFHWLRQLLESLPLPSNEYYTAITRLKNGRQYVAEGETGAALYELQMLLRSLVVTD